VPPAAVQPGDVRIPIRRGSIREGLWPSLLIGHVLEGLASGEFTVFAAGIWISALVAGFRPTRAVRAPGENDPKPISWTVSPFVTSVVIAPTNAWIASPVDALLSPVEAGTAATSSCLFRMPFRAGERQPLIAAARRFVPRCVM
jgi:hypothetical protein